MKRILFALTALSFVLLFSNCQSSNSGMSKVANWHRISVIEDVELLVNNASIRHEGALAYADEKRVFLTDESKKQYVDKIRNEYAKMGKPEKAAKWNNFSYCIYNSVYDCTNKRFKVVSVEDYDAAGKRIARTVPRKGKEEWLTVNPETVGDYSFFHVCDYGN